MKTINQTRKLCEQIELSKDYGSFWFLTSVNNLSISQQQFLFNTFNYLQSIVSCPQNEVIRTVCQRQR